MTNCCHRCNVQETVGQELAEVAPLLGWRRRYCPSCMALLHHRFSLLLLLCVFGLGTFGAIHSLLGNRPLLDSTAVWMALIFLLQWLLIVPHELGHAIAARLA